MTRESARLFRTIVCGGKAATAKDVGERVDGEGPVPEHHGADHEAPDQRVNPAHRKEDGCQDQRWNEVKAVEKAKLRVLGHVRNGVVVGGVKTRGEDPADVRPKEAALNRRMDIFGLVGIAMVVPVPGSPPKRPLLHGGPAPEGEKETETPGRSEKTGGRSSDGRIPQNAEHPRVVEADAKENIAQRGANQDGSRPPPTRGNPRTAACGGSFSGGKEEFPVGGIADHGGHESLSEDLLQ